MTIYYLDYCQRLISTLRACHSHGAAFVRRAALLGLVTGLAVLELVPAQAATNVPYLDASGTLQTAATATELITGGGAASLSSGWYVCNAGTAVAYTGTLTVQGDVTLILADGCQMNVTGTAAGGAGIDVSGANRLTITAQSTGAGMGALVAAAGVGDFSNPGGAGIGGASSYWNPGSTAGTITINGGAVTVTGGGGGFASGAGIGGGASSEGNGGAGGTVTINGGTVTATGGNAAASGAGIGGGGSSKATAGSGGTLAIHGGTVTATGGQGTYAAGAGIGGGGAYAEGGSGGTVTIDGESVVNANGGRWSGAGIGGGGSNRKDGSSAGAAGTLTIGSDSAVTAYGGGSASGATDPGAPVGAGGTSGMGSGAAQAISGMYRLSVSKDATSSGAGTVSPTGVWMITGKANMSFTFTPIGGSVIKQVSVNGMGIGTPASYTASGLTQDTTVVVTFAYPLTGSVAISGSAVVGQSLGVNTAGILQVQPGALSYQWLRDGSAIAGATGASYTLTAADANQSISVQVGSALYAGVLTSLSVQALPLLTGTIDISGSPVVKQVLTASATGTPAGSTLAYQWLRGGTPIDAALASTHTLVTADIGQAISVQVSATGYGGVLNSSAVTASKITPVITSPQATPITYGQTLASSTPSGAGVDGSFAWVDATTAPSGAGTSSYPATFTPTDPANYNTVALSIAVTTNPTAPTLSLTPASLSTITLGGSANVSAALAGATNPTGTVSFSDDGVTLCSARVDGTGTASCSVPGLLLAGDHPINASYAGDSNNQDATSSVQTLTVNPASVPLPGTGAGASGTAQVSISGPAGCLLDVAPTIAAATQADQLPPDATAPLGLLRFAVKDGGLGGSCSSVQVRAVYPSGSLAGLAAYKYGPHTQMTGATPTTTTGWYALTEAGMVGDAMSYSVADNGDGDSDSTAGRIDDPSAPLRLPGAAAAPTSVPTLGHTELVLLVLLLAGGAVVARRTNRKEGQQ
ncbi:Ig-like domain repeat protein [Comamonas piscis]|uniref:Ig-like domain repeat protein n=1 Tax=Comamonas piscis TaxID=1562974 RepID=A0A7G5EG96_9BURK|nr:Ig-like domain repeat protein [Comamonas piscis]QMV73021.1 Ig-like domain repeat protein [Comamonas piscis]WSO35806.1 Ig-like domain repeat protein [Comamonas piscis]